MPTINRRYDIDWVRVIAIGLLLIYHVAIGFQPWGIMIGFIANEKTWGSLWIPMQMLNIWRIPLLFFVSGMGVYFAIQNRNWKQLLMERSRVSWFHSCSGCLLFFPSLYSSGNPITILIRDYSANPGHLWFLGNIFLYVVILLPVFFFFKKNESGPFVSSIKRVFGSPLGLVLVIVCLRHRSNVSQAKSLRIVCHDLARILPGICGIFLRLLLCAKWRKFLDHDVEMALGIFNGRHTPFRDPLFLF